MFIYCFYMHSVWPTLLVLSTPLFTMLYEIVKKIRSQLNELTKRVYRYEIKIRSVTKNYERRSEFSLTIDRYLTPNCFCMQYGQFAVEYQSFISSKYWYKAISDACHGIRTINYTP